MCFSNIKSKKAFFILKWLFWEVIEVLPIFIELYQALLLLSTFFIAVGSIVSSIFFFFESAYWILPALALFVGVL